MAAGITKAIIDLGSNTFNLLIATVDKSNLYIHIQEERPVKLGKGSFMNGLRTLQSEAIERAMNTLNEFNTIIKSYNVNEVHAFGTSALRDAINGEAFINEAFINTGIMIKIISGDEEAALIYEGVKCCGGLNEYPALIVDIGGGSVELILADNTGILWKRSYNLGAVRMMEKFPFSDPAKVNEINRLEEYLKTELSDFNKVINQYKPIVFVGCSGCFESIRDILEPMLMECHNLPYKFISLNDFYFLYANLKSSTINERKSINGLVDFRVETIVTALVITQVIMSLANTVKFLQCDYAMKEGILWTH